MVYGRARFRFSDLNTNQYIEFDIDSADGRIVDTVPGWSHSISNIGDRELIVMLWANELFDQKKPDTVISRMPISEEKLKVMTIVGTRPEIIRLSRVIAALEIYCDHILVHTGQNFDYELNQIFDDLGIRKPNFFLDSANQANGPSETIGSIISKVDDVLKNERPDAVLVLGDTNSCLSVIPLKRRKIPIFHMEAGNRCFDFRVPEEINRRSLIIPLISI